MSTAVQRILQSIEALPDLDKHQATVEILRRYSGAAEGDVPQDALVGIADELFRAMDKDEAGNAPS